MTTFLPRNWLSLTVLPRWLFNSKSGASSPTFRAAVWLAREVVPLVTAIAVLRGLQARARLIGGLRSRPGAAPRDGGVGPRLQSTVPQRRLSAPPLACQRHGRARHKPSGGRRARPPLGLWG